MPAFVRMHRGSTKVSLVGICVPWVAHPAVAFFLVSSANQMRLGEAFTLSTTMQAVELLDGEGAESLAGHRMDIAIED